MCECVRVWYNGFKVPPEREFEIELESGHSGRSLSFLVVEGDPELNQLQEVDVGL